MGEKKQKKLKSNPNISKIDVLILYRDTVELKCRCKITNAFISCFVVQLLKMLATFQAAMEGDLMRPVKDHQSTFKNTRRVWECGKHTKMGEGEYTKETREMTENFIEV